jgi:AbrB family looped-hinge helix DNA binding protein
MRVTSKGQVTIPRELRALTGIEPNSEVVFAIEGGKLTIAPKDASREVEERQRLDRFMAALRRMEGTGDQALDAEALARITRDRD